MMFVKTELRSRQAKNGLTRKQLQRQFGNRHRVTLTETAASGPDVIDLAEDEDEVSEKNPPSRLDDEDLIRDVADGRVSLLDDNTSDQSDDEETERNIQALLDDAADHSDTDGDFDDVLDDRIVELSSGKKVCSTSFLPVRLTNCIPLLGHPLLWD